VEHKSGCRFYGHWNGNKLREQAVGRHFARAQTSSLGIANSNTDGFTLNANTTYLVFAFNRLRGG
jgi:hypothetical protein